MGLCLSVYVSVAVVLSLAMLLDIQFSNSSQALARLRNGPDGLVKHVVAGSQLVDIGPECWILFRKLRKYELVGITSWH